MKAIYQQGYAVCGVGTTEHDAIEDAKQWTDDGQVTLGQRGVVGDVVVVDAIVVNGKVYRWDDLEAALPRDVADSVDARDYDTPEAWWDAYCATYDDSSDYSPEWLLSVTPSYEL